MKNLLLFFIAVFFVQPSKSQNGLCLSAVPDPGLYAMSTPALDKADFNNDGKEDICTTGFINTPPYNSPIKLFLSTGSGSFSVSDYNLNFFNSSNTHRVDFIKTCDFNSDGNQDIFVLCHSDSIFFLSGTGTGSLNAAVSFSLPYAPTTLITSDFNNDGKKDIVVASSNTPSLSVLFGNGSGGFSSMAHYGLSLPAQQLVTGDFNNNNATDIFAITGSTSYFLKGSATGIFTISSSFNFDCGNLKAVDINSDNKLDLIYSDVINDKLCIRLGNGNFTFGNASVYPVTKIRGGSNITSLGTVEAADFNKDGHIDIAVLSNDIALTIFTGASNGAFPNSTTYTVNMTGLWFVFNLIPADINGDGKADIVALADDMGVTPFSELKVFLNCNITDVEHFVESNYSLHLFPNPANDFLTLEFSEEQTNDFKKISIYNNVGQLVKEQELILLDNNYHLNLNELPDGFYSLQLNYVSSSNSLNSLSKKFLISR